MAKKKRKVVEIKRSRWASASRLSVLNNGREAFEPVVEPSLYCGETKLMCCLGFVCRAEGYKVADIRNHGLPSALDEVPEWLTSIEEAAVELNDACDLTDAEREQKLKQLFREKSPIDLKFVP